MKIAYMHFHLKTGGVTTVIRQQVETLKNACEAVVLSGVLPETDFPCKVIPIPGIGYDSDINRRMDPGKTADAVIEAIFSHWPGGCDILHVHNPILAKNRNYLKILKRLQDKGLRLFLQIHDFAEDGRPGVYFKDDYISDCHYGVINSRDYDILIKSGLKPEGLHRVGNMVTPLPTDPEPGDVKGHILYPVRAIRRKNIGEAILLACFFPENRPLLITLPPNSPADFPAYESWKRFVSRHTLNVEFEAGLKNDFISLVHSSASLVTTSISEGFGFSFMEPWTAGKYLWGRDLTGITDDFKINNIALDHLYTKIRTPLKWLVPDGFFHVWRKAVLDNLALFGLESERFTIREEFNRLVSDGTIDFGLLNEKSQQTVINRILKSRENKKQFKKLNPFLADCGRSSVEASVTASNCALVKDRYSAGVYRETLMAAYGAVLSRNPIQSIDKTKLLSEFFRFDSFSLLKWGRHDT